MARTRIVLMLTQGSMLEAAEAGDATERVASTGRVGSFQRGGSVAPGLVAVAKITAGESFRGAKGIAKSVCNFRHR
jgi:hypothetical protein